MRRLLVLIVFATVISGASAAQAATPEGSNLEVRVERATDVQTRLAQWVPIHVIILDRRTHTPPKDKYLVVALATNQSGETTKAFDCAQMIANNPGTPKGVYECTVIVEHGGLWTLKAVVNELPPESAPSDTPIIKLAEGSVDLKIDAGALQNLAPKANAIRGRARDVVLLEVHTLCAAAWALCVLLLLSIALPAIRRRLAAATLHHLEDRFGVLARAVAGMTVLVVGTGLYLMAKQTAYKSPWSTTAAHAVLRLPYARPYFLSLWLKVATYVLMAVAVIPIVREAGRRIRLTSDDRPVLPRARPDDRSPWDPGQSAAGNGPPGAPGSGVTASPASRAGTVGTVTVAREPLPAPAGESVNPPAPGRRGAPAVVRVSAVMVGMGGATVLVCVTLLKYFHELVEATRGALPR